MENSQKRFEIYQEVLTQGNYFYHQKKQVIAMFHGFFYRFETFQDVVGENQEESLISFVANDYQDKVDLNVSHYFEPNLSSDAFILKVKASGDIDIRTSDLRGFKYALEALFLLFEKQNQYICYPIIEIKHQPSFQIRGVIEGFYGEPWTHDIRKDVLTFLSKEHLNTYMYAPKDDELQRKRWRELYDSKKLVEFKELIALAEINQIDFYYMISPGNDIDYTIDSDLIILKNKLQQLISIGVRHFGLLLDDIDYILKDNIKIKFQTAAKAHAYLVKEVEDFLKNQLADFQLIVCPTEYDNRFSSPYLVELTKEVPSHIPFFWTGPATLASQISEEEVKRMSACYNRPLIIWDNIPVNDYLNDKECLFLSPYENRSKFLASSEYQVLGIVSNPMSQWELSKLTIQNMSQYLWNTATYQGSVSWEKTISSYTSSEFSDALTIFSQFCPNKYTRASYSIEQILNINNKNHHFITTELDKLLLSVEQLKKLDNLAFQQEIKPWFERVYKDREIWDLILNNEKEQAIEKSKQFLSYPHRFGCDLVAAYMKKHFKEGKEK